MEKNPSNTLFIYYLLFNWLDVCAAFHNFGSLVLVLIDGDTFNLDRSHADVVWINKIEKNSSNTPCLFTIYCLID